MGIPTVFLVAIQRAINFYYVGEDPAVINNEWTVL